MITNIRPARLLTGSSALKIVVCLASRVDATANLRQLMSTSNYLPTSDAFSKRRYTADGHYWIRTSKHEKEKTSYFEIGVTDHVFDSVILGSIDSVSIPTLRGNENSSSCSSLALHWSGLKVGTGDELYHSVWENVYGVFEVEPFLPTRLSDLNVLEYNSKMNQKKESFSDEWLLRFSCDESEPELLSVPFLSLRNQKEHDDFCLLQSSAVERIAF